MTKPDNVNRYLLPIHDRQHVGLTTYDAKDPDTAFPPITEVHPPEGSPNVLIILLDDIGFGAASTFGGAINTPTADRLAARGLKLSRFHTTALCAPSRQALLTGRNHQGGDTTLFVDGQQVASARQEASIPMLFSGDETLDIGGDHATSVSDDYTPTTSDFTGTVHWVQLDQGLDDQSHLITPEDRMKVAMVRQ